MKKHIPNFITSLNLLAGCLGIVLAFQQSLLWASGMIALAVVFDYFDGTAARLLNVKSEIGKQLDSLADVVSFGILPCIIIYKIIGLNIINFNYLTTVEGFMQYYPYIAFLIPVFSALRLAKFNVDVRQTDSFIGLPTPANAILIASLPFIIDRTESVFLYHLLMNPYFMILLTVVLSFLLISEIPMFSLKLNNLKWQDNKLQFVLIFIAVLLILILDFVAIPIIIILYIILSIVNNLIVKLKKN